MVLKINEIDLEFLKKVADGEITDDANLDEDSMKTSRRLYQNGYIEAVPMEGSDEPIDCLSLTDKGRFVLDIKPVKDEGEGYRVYRGFMEVPLLRSAVLVAHEAGEEYEKSIRRVELKADQEIDWRDQEIRRLQEEVDRLRAMVNALEMEREGEVWYWLGDGEDHVESLTCPVLIEAAALRGILGNRSDKLREMVAELDLVIKKTIEELKTGSVEKALILLKGGGDD
jgi:hypothetical protein